MDEWLGTEVRDVLERVHFWNFKEVWMCSYAASFSNQMLWMIGKWSCALFRDLRWELKAVDGRFSTIRWSLGGLSVKIVALSTFKPEKCSFRYTKWWQSMCPGTDPQRALIKPQDITTWIIVFTNPTFKLYYAKRIRMITLSKGDINSEVQAGLEQK